MYLRSAVVAAALVVATGPAWSHGDNHGGQPAAKPASVSTQEHAFGRAGDPRRVTRTFQVGMDDRMHFRATAALRHDGKSDARPGDAHQMKPGDIVVKRGETVRFVVRNHGKAMHEMVIGTMRELKDHAELMRKFPGMEHDEPYMAHVAPGKQGEIVWQFTKPGEFYYGCLVPGHMEAGMVAKITVQ
ncbi:MAG TPA: cupredoxin family protein [Steroidobacteraceae bacterium]|nr:cupredoxin family protein [Steroidobacteraceae bacterium]